MSLNQNTNLSISYAKMPYLGNHLMEDKMINCSKFLTIFFCAAIASAAYADETITINLVGPKGAGKAIGTVTLSDTQYGLLLTPNLTDLPPGQHGFHIHVTPACGDNGMAAHGHLDPNNTNKHLGPYNNNGHLGDLPALFVDNNGRATTPVLAPRLKLKDVKNHAIMIHAGGDNYSDNPPLGGGNARIACGVIPG